MTENLPIALMLKSYSGDFAFAQRLVESFTRHNPEGLTLFCVVPKSDLAMFATLASEHVVVMDESPFEGYFVTEELNGTRPGYINQEIVKLAFHELGLAENYFCIDSDAVIIRDLHSSDFLAPDGYPYSVLVESNELKVEPRYYAQYWESREAALARIAEVIGIPDSVMLTCHGHQVFSTEALRSFVSEFLAPRGWAYRDALAEAPYEFTWYNFWLQKSGVIPIHSREELVKVFHHENQHFEYILRGVTEADMARGYLAVVVNSNYSRGMGVLPADAPKPQALAPYLSYGEVVQLIGAKAADTFRRRFKRSR
jgi:Family of unknown function (DUF6492)